MKELAALPEGGLASDPAERPAVLIVDDNHANLVALHAVIESLDVDVVQADSGEAALKALLQREFAVVLMDVQMPGLDGFQTTELIRRRERSRHTPIIFVTAIFIDREWAKKGYSLGALDYLTKPFDEEILKAKVAALIGAKRQEDLVRRQAEALREAERQAHLAEVAREQAEAANRAKDDFLAMVSHELRAPLNAVLGWSLVVEASAELPAALMRPAQIIVRNARAQSQLIDDLLDVSRMAAGKLRVTPAAADFRAIVLAAVESIRPATLQSQLTLELDVADGDYAVTGDRARLEQAVGNVLSNAIKFSRANGRIEVRLERHDHTVELRVADEGIGITPAFLPHVFERFRQGDAGRARQHGGLGIGLTLARSLVQLHGGSIIADSAGEGRGATFTIELPAGVRDTVERAAVGEAEAVDVAAPVTAVAAAGGVLAGVAILVVDDDADARELLAAILTRAGAAVVTAASADEAFRATRSTRFDAITSDLGMPGEDGLSLMRRIRAAEAPDAEPIAAVAISGYGSIQDREESRRAGFVAHVVKPSDPSHVVALLARVLRRT